MHKFSTIVRDNCLRNTQGMFDHLCSDHGFEMVDTDGKGRLAFRPGKSKYSPLIVCHADTVANGGDGLHKWAYHKGVATSIALDDRLGISLMIWIIVNGLPMADCAFLVCDEEEVGNTTARLFDMPVDPNWMVEFDRRGTDVVCYDYETTLFNSILTSFGFIVGSGSFSDISYLDNLEVCGFNMGVGYHNEHSDRCHAKLSDTLSQLDKLHDFYHAMKDVRLAHDQKQSYSSSWADDWSDYRGSYGTYSSSYVVDNESAAQMQSEVDRAIEILEDVVRSGLWGNAMPKDAIDLYEEYGYPIDQDPAEVLADFEEYWSQS